MRGISLGISAFARTAANFGGGSGCTLASESTAYHVSYRTQAPSNASTCSENRYPSPLARSVLSPYGSRRSSLRLAFARFGVGHNFYVNRLGFADQDAFDNSRFARCCGWDRIIKVVTTSEAVKKCANPFSFLLSSPPRHLLVACRQMASARSPVRPQVPSSRVQPTITRLPVLRLAPLPAPIATTRAFVSNSIRLTPARFARRSDIAHQSFPGAPAGGAFFVPDPMANAVAEPMTEISGPRLKLCGLVRLEKGRGAGDV